MSETTSGHSSRAASGTSMPTHDSKSPPLSVSAVISDDAVRGPMPGTSPSTRSPAIASRGFSARRRKLTRSLTCAISTKRSPPYLRKGMLRRESSISSAIEWCCARKSTHWCLSSVPCSRWSRMRSHSQLVCSASSRQVTSDGPPAALARGPEVLLAALGRLGDDRVGRREDRRRRPVVAGEGCDLGAGEAQLEVEDVAHGGSPEAVDRLRVVADARHARAVRPQPRDDVGLQRVGVLVLVDEHVVEAFAHPLAGVRIAEQPVPEQQQVVVVEDLLLLLHVGVACEEELEVVFGLAAPRERRLEDIGERELRVDAPRVDVEARRLLREPRPAAAQAEFGAGEVHEVFGVASVEDREVGLHADVAGVDAQQPGGDRVERAAPDARAGELGTAALGAAAQDPVDAAHHLARGAPRERQQQDAAGIRSAWR